MLTQIDTLKRGKDLGVKENCYIVLKYQAVEEKMDITNKKKILNVLLQFLLVLPFLTLLSFHCVAI